MTSKKSVRKTQKMGTRLSGGEGEPHILNGDRSASADVESSVSVNNRAPLCESDRDAAAVWRSSAVATVSVGGAVSAELATSGVAESDETQATALEAPHAAGETATGAGAVYCGAGGDDRGPEEGTKIKGMTPLKKW
jgi:hypothetical protein